MPPTTTFDFRTFVYRGRHEREYAVDVTYSVTPFRDATWTQPAEGGDVEVLSTCVIDGDELTDAEFDLIVEECEDRAGTDMAEWLAERDEYRADMRRDDRMLAQWRAA